MPEVDTGSHDLDDGRPNGDWKTRFDCTAWLQIVVELAYLCIVLSACVVLLLDAASTKENAGEATGQIGSALLGIQFSIDRANWIALALAGMIGGTVFDLKWLYHSVARGVWNRDRVLWRLIVPWNSAMVSLFTGFLVASGVVPFLKNEAFDEIYTVLGCGFLFGYFSDNILAAMQNFARKIFGTLHSED